MTGLGALDRSEPECSSVTRLLISNCTTWELYSPAPTLACLAQHRSRKVQLQQYHTPGVVGRRKPGIQHGTDCPQHRRGAAGEGYAALFQTPSRGAVRGEEWMQRATCINVFCWAGEGCLDRSRDPFPWRTPRCFEAAVWRFAPEVFTDAVQLLTEHLLQKSVAITQISR